MSVIVKGMELPENCDTCIFSDWSNLHQTSSCKLKGYEPSFSDFSRDYTTQRSGICPLVEVEDDDRGHAMSAINREDTIKALEDVSAMFPYRIPGVTETYRPYNEAWNDAIDKAEQAIEALPDADDGWIPVEKRLPEYGVLVLTYNTDDYCLNHIIDEETGEWFWDGANAWMPLPKPYKPKEDK